MLCCRLIIGRSRSQPCCRHVTSLRFYEWLGRVVPHTLIAASGRGMAFRTDEADAYVAAFHDLSCCFLELGVTPLD